MRAIANNLLWCEAIGTHGSSLLFSSDSLRLYHSELRAGTRVLDAATGIVLQTFTPLGEPGAVSMALSPAGNTLAGAFMDGTIKLWDVADWSKVDLLTIQGQIKSICNGISSRIWG